MKFRLVTAPALRIIFAFSVMALLLQGCDGSNADKESAFTLSFDQAGKVTEITKDADAQHQFVYVTGSGSWTLEARDDEDMGLTMTSVSLGVSNVTTISSKGDSGPIQLNFPVNKDDGPRTIEFYATSGSNVQYIYLTQKGREEVVSGGGGTYTPINGGGGQQDASGNTIYIDNANGGRATSAPFKWLELPATDDRDEYHYVWHNFSKGGSYYRNYSFYWDYDNLVAMWVAYPLYRWTYETKDTGRTNAWGADPMVDAAKQPDVSAGFKDGNDGWRARGHQMPSADRFVGNSNYQTFYGTNMTPQIQDGFNGGIWEKLEEKVRAWADKSDTLYVVTGCTVAGSTKYVYDNATPQKKVTIPTGYYKAVVAYSNSASFPGYPKGGYMGCAVWLDHKEYSSSSITKSLGMSIDALEAKIGLDLFVNLPSVVGSDNAAAIEAENPQNVSWWW